MVGKADTFTAKVEFRGTVGLAHAAHPPADAAYAAARSHRWLPVRPAPHAYTGRGYGAGRNGSGLPMNTAHRRPVRGDGAVGYSRTSIPNNSAALAVVARATSSKLIPRSSAMRSATYIT